VGEVRPQRHLDPGPGERQRAGLQLWRLRLQLPGLLEPLRARNWLYQLDASDIYSTAAQYEWLNRTLVAHELNLTMDQRRELQQFLEWNLRPENREYRYDYFRDNCSTRIRDAIDRVLGGSLRAATENRADGYHVPVAQPAADRGRSRRVRGDEHRPRARRRPSDLDVGGDVPPGEAAGAGAPAPGGGRRRFRPAAAARGARHLPGCRAEPERAEAPVRWPVFLLVGLALAGALLLLGSRFAP
jgi:hypothetical protein